MQSIDITIVALMGICCRHACTRMAELLSTDTYKAGGLVVDGQNDPLAVHTLSGHVTF